jgi:hypothetical protein
MDMLLGVILYLVIVTGFAFFGRFLKDCDETLFEQLETDPVGQERVI